MILIITHKEDYTTDIVVNKLNQLGLKYYRFNTEDFIDKVTIDVNIRNDRIFPEVIINEIDRIKSVWFRRVRLPEIKGVSSPYEKTYIQNEVDMLFSNLWEIIDANWLSIPRKVYQAENKLLQLKKAMEINFNIPKTLVSNNPKSIRSFYFENNRNIIIKPVYHNRVVYGDSQELIFTNKIEEKHIENLDSFLRLPSVFQERIEKELELRITVVGNSVFSAFVNSQSDEETKIDWRRKKLQFSKFELPKKIENLCVALVKSFDLSFGAIDLILDKKGEFYFLEINPNGQWGWIEFDTGLPISDAIIEFLRKQI